MARALDCICNKILILSFVSLGLVNVLSAVEFKQTNLLFIMYDDLRPELSIYGRKHMITPNFERLAAKSVVFDYAFCQIAVCNPSRDSLMTGLRPDSVGTYNFGHSYWPHLSLPAQLVKSGYQTAGIGKVFHWETTDKNVWSFDAFDNRWYDYQNEERGPMNASTQPDKVRPLEKFRDYEFLTRALSTWERMLAANKPHMLAIGFKLPHLALHVPYEYYRMYKGREKEWMLNKRELRFPPTASEISYRCCAEMDFQLLRQDGELPHNRSVPIGDINQPIPQEVYAEITTAYNAGVTFLDFLLGKLLDFMDEKKLWDSTTLVLSSDHGIHSGEKGMWEKWTLFEEATRVPLIIHHPLSPFAGQHYKLPVESIDIYATLNDLLKLSMSREEAGKGMKVKPLQGKSLAPVILGKPLYEKHIAPMHRQHASLLSKLGHTLHYSAPSVLGMPVMDMQHAISQVIRCVQVSRAPPKLPRITSKHNNSVLHHRSRSHVWEDCNPERPEKDTIMLLGYAMRTPEYRYIAYFHFNKTTHLPELDTDPYEQELYSHRNETLADFTHRETYNLAVRLSYEPVLTALRAKLTHFIKTQVRFGDH